MQYTNWLIGGGIGFISMLVLNYFLSSKSYHVLTDQPVAVFVLTIRSGEPKYTEYDLTKKGIHLVGYQPVQPAKWSKATEAAELFLYVKVRSKDHDSIQKLKNLGFRETGALPTLTPYGTNPHDLYFKLS
mgnify:CR=1 FL=1